MKDQLTPYTASRPMIVNTGLLVPSEMKWRLRTYIQIRCKKTLNWPSTEFHHHMTHSLELSYCRKHPWIQELHNDVKYMWSLKSGCLGNQGHKIKGTIFCPMGVQISNLVAFALEILVPFSYKGSHSQFIHVMKSVLYYIFFHTITQPRVHWLPVHNTW